MDNHDNSALVQGRLVWSKSDDDASPKVSGVSDMCYTPDVPCGRTKKIILLLKMPTATDPSLYDKVKRSVYRKHPKHSAYRSGLLVQRYKRAFRDKYGSKRSPYRGQKTPHTGLSRWFDERWTNQRGEIGYRYKSDVYRPTRKVTHTTPKTFDELSQVELTRARRKKSRLGRVNRF